MWKDWSYKKRNQALLILSGIGVLMIWWLAVSDTVGLMSDCMELQRKIEVTAGLSSSLQDLNLRQQRLSAITGTDGDQSEDLHQELLERVSGYCAENGLVLEEFPQPMISQTNDFQVETTIFKVEGRFVPLLRLVYDLEQVWALGKISGVSFASRKNNRANRKELTVSICFQQVKHAKA